MTILSASFQCSSASRKFLNTGAVISGVARAVVSVLFSEPKIPQLYCKKQSPQDHSFSALQRAENSSIPPRCSRRWRLYSFQCSSASRKFLNCCSGLDNRHASRVSVLFSEPKIPQSARYAVPLGRDQTFQCSSASRKFLNIFEPDAAIRARVEFQCSSASRKFLNSAQTARRAV